MMVEDIILEKNNETIEDKLILFFENVSLSNIHISVQKLDEFKDLYLDYYKKPMTKTCSDGIVHAYSALYYTTQKIIRQKNG